MIVFWQLRGSSQGLRRLIDRSLRFLCLDGAARYAPHVHFRLCVNDVWGRTEAAAPSGCQPDSSSPEQRNRYQSVQLLLSQDANDYNNRAVEFRLEELIPNTNQWRAYETAMFTLKRSFTSDFDF